jgi:hypothetical protein
MPTRPGGATFPRCLVLLIQALSQYLAQHPVSLLAGFPERFMSMAFTVARSLHVRILVEPAAS